MILDLSTGRLGDVLLALPAMRDGDRVICRRAHRVPGAPVVWVEPTECPNGSIVTTTVREPGLHVTDGWLLATDRDAFRHRLLPEPPRRGLTVLAEAVGDPGRSWPHWRALRAMLPDAVIVSASMPRPDWMRLLSRASVVICPNTGTAHMADALGVPRVVGLYADTQRDFLPYWTREHCVIRPDVYDISVQDVLNAAASGD